MTSTLAALITALQQDDLRYAFSSDPTDDVIRRTCDDVTGIPEDLRIYVFDEAGNYATCEVGLLLTDCTNQFSIGGRIATATVEPVEGVEIHVEGDMDMMVLTPADGSYDVSGMELGNNYSIRPMKDNDLLNGVSTYDLVLISQHLRGIRGLDGPYNLIAADVNNTGSISAFDIIELRKALLFISTSFPDNTSWRFIDETFVFPNAADPFATTFPEVYNINGFAGSLSGVDFVGVKVGDVDGSVRANVNSVSSSTRSGGSIELNIADRALAAGEEVEVSLNAADFADIAGYQFELKLNGLELIGTETADLAGVSASNFGVTESGIATSWSQAEGADLTAEEALFTVKLRATRAVQLSEAISLGETLSAEAYGSDLSVKAVNLTFTGSASGEFALLQNTPNPFRNETTIGFVLPEAGSATLTIFDVSGKVLRQVEGEYGQGYNEVRVNRSDLSGAGVLYYTLESANLSATKKMIIIE